ncbi:MAG: hypothetical protein JXR77_14205 [Lentisphaeria bacterium]|nr:hypothetical protein [Lentisphaeria bacterium]
MDGNGDENPRIHRHTLVEMNLPVFTARRDAAHARAADILRLEIEKGDREQRAERYESCLRLIEEALRCTERSQMAHDSHLMHYLRLLRDTLKAKVALVHHEITLVAEAREFATILGEETVARLLTARDVFSDSERHVLGFMRGLLEFGEPLRSRDTEERKRRFSEDDWRRFRHAAGEYEVYYSTYGR